MLGLDEYWIKVNTMQELNVQVSNQTLICDTSYHLLQCSLCWRHLPVYLCEVLRVAAGGEGGGEGDGGDHGQHQPQQPHARRVAGRRHVARQVHLPHGAARASNEPLRSYTNTLCPEEAFSFHC